MNIAIVTGPAGLIGVETVEFFSSEFDHIIGIDNNFREKTERKTFTPFRIWEKEDNFNDMKYDSK